MNEKIVSSNFSHLIRCPTLNTPVTCDRKYLLHERTCVDLDSGLVPPERLNKFSTLYIISYQATDARGPFGKINEIN